MPEACRVVWWYPGPPHPTTHAPKACRVVVQWGGPTPRACPDRGVDRGAAAPTPTGGVVVGGVWVNISWVAMVRELCSLNAARPPRGPLPPTSNKFERKGKEPARRPGHLLVDAAAFLSHLGLSGAVPSLFGCDLALPTAATSCGEGGSASVLDVAGSPNPPQH